MEKNNIYQIPDSQVIWRLLEPEVMLVVPDQMKSHMLNEVGGRIWTLVDGKHSISEIALIIWKEYDVDLAEVEADTQAFLHLLYEKGLLTLANNPG